MDAKGDLLWKFRSGPSQRKVIGHERLMSAWPGGAVTVVNKDKVIVVAGHWPVDGVYVHGLDASTGKVLWTNASAQYRPSDLMQVDGGKVFVYGYGSGGAYDVATGRTLADDRPKLTLPEPLPVPEGVEGDVVVAR